MAETTTKKKDYTIKELWDYYTVALDFRDKATYAVKEQNDTGKILPSTVARFNFYNKMCIRLEELMSEKMEDLSGEIFK